MIFFTGPDPGHISNSINWKKTTPSVFRSPFMAQGDIGNAFFFPLFIFFLNNIFFYLGFFNYKNKKYGAFFCGVQSFSGAIFATPIKDLKVATLFKAIESMKKVLNPIPPC